MARLLLWLATAGGAAHSALEPAALPAPRLLEDGKPHHHTCAVSGSPYPDGLHAISIHLDGIMRRFLVFKPTGNRGITTRVPLWILAPGAYDTAEEFLAMCQMTEFAQEHKIAFVVLQGAGGGSARLLNVALRSRSLPGLPDDIRYTRVVLRMVTQRLCVDMDRIRCTGYSRGARFCSRLASEFSSFIAGIAPVGGVRFPSPNNATRSLPIIAIHGTRDDINPYWGKGDPSYWEHSVPDAITKWANFNGCKSAPSWHREASHVAIESHVQCKDDADVVLVMVQGGGHTWPGSTYNFARRQFGPTTRAVSANQLMFKFFQSHPRRNGCRTAVEGSPCYDAVWEAMKEGLRGHPEWADRLNASSSFQDYQEVLHNGFYADCPRPCPGSPLTTPEPTAAPAGATAVASSATATTTAATTTTATVTTTVTTEAPEVKERQAREASLKLIEGNWTHKQDPGGFVETVEGGQIHWDSGVSTDMLTQGPGEYSTKWQGSTSHAHLAGGNLQWDDGDVWIRARGASHRKVGKKDGKSITIRSMKDKATLFERLPSSTPAVAAALAGLLCVGVVAAVFITASLAARTVRQLVGSASPLEEQLRLERVPLA